MTIHLNPKQPSIFNCRCSPHSFAAAVARRRLPRPPPRRIKPGFNSSTASANTRPARSAGSTAAPTWSVGPMDISGLIDGYYSYNANRPSDAANGQVNDLYNFNDKTDQFNLSEARLTLNHDPDPVGAHSICSSGATNTLVNGGSHDQGDYIEQAFLSLKPPKAKGLGAGLRQIRDFSRGGGD